MFVICLLQLSKNYFHTISVSKEILLYKHMFFSPQFAALNFKRQVKIVTVVFGFKTDG